MSSRVRFSTGPRQSPSSRMRWSIIREAEPGVREVLFFIVLPAMGLTPITTRLGASRESGSMDRPDVGEHAARVPGGEGSDERRGAVEFDAALARGLGP